jgi:HEAT repeat protein
MNTILIHTLGMLLGSLSTLASLTAIQDETPTSGSEPVADQEYLPLGSTAWEADPELVKTGIERLAARMRVESDHREFAGQLELVRRRAATVEPYPEQGEFLVQIALLRSKALLALGRTEEARQALWKLVPDGADPRWANDEKLAPAPPALIELVKQMQSHPDLVRAREALGESDDGSGAEGEGGRSMRATVLHALEKREWQTIQTIGSRASPIVMETLLVAPDQIVPGTLGKDPVWLLNNIGTAQAASLLLEHIDAGGNVWKGRIMRVMESGRVLRGDGVWISTNSDQSNSICTVPEWVEILEILLRTPGLGHDCLPLVDWVLHRDGLTPGLVRGLIEIVSSAEKELPRAVIRLLASQPVSEKEKPLLEHCVRLSDPLLRGFAARRLAQLAESEALLELADDPDPEIRRIVAFTLRPARRVTQRIGFKNGASVNLDVTRSMGERERAVLLRLLRDENSEVRMAALRSAASQHAELGDEPFLEMLDDPDVKLRETLGGTASNLPDTLAAHILTSLATDAEPAVAEVVWSVMRNRFNGPLECPAPFIPTLFALRDSKTYARHIAVYRGLLGSFIQVTESNIPLIVTHALARDDEVLREVFRNVGTRSFPTPDDAFAASLLARLYRLGDRAYVRFLESLRESDHPRHGCLQLILDDEDMPFALRLRAAEAVAGDGGETVLSGIRNLLAAPSWRRNGLSDEDMNTLIRMVRSVPYRERNRLLLGFVSDESLPDRVCVVLMDAYVPGLPLGPEISRKILDRWLENPPSDYNAVVKAIEQLGLEPGDRGIEMLIAASRRPEYTLAAVEAMDGLWDPRFLPILGRCLEARWLAPGSGEQQQVRLAAAETLTGYFSDEAVAVLVAGLRTTDSEVWNRCIKGIETIQEYQRRVSAWENSGTPRPTVENAVTSLVALLEDPDPLLRIEAARGLATLDAVECLPLLIGMLKDSEAEVRAAAREALDRLNAPKPEEKEEETATEDPEGE